MIDGVNKALDLAEECFKALVIWQPEEPFSVGADLQSMLPAFMMGDWDTIDQIVRRFQNTSMRLRYSHVPTVAATQGYVFGGGCEFAMLSSYSARKLGLQTTGNAGGPHNLLVRSTGESFEQLLRQMGTGLLVTELLGQGVNTVTGDYSRGAAGFWVENGVIAYPVEEITVADNLRDMFHRVLAVGNDLLVRGSTQIGSVLLESIAVAGQA